MFNFSVYWVYAVNSLDHRMYMWRIWLIIKSLNHLSTILPVYNEQENFKFTVIPCNEGIYCFFEERFDKVSSCSLLIFTSLSYDKDEFKISPFGFLTFPNLGHSITKNIFLSVCPRILVLRNDVSYRFQIWCVGQ